MSKKIIVAVTLGLLISGMGHSQTAVAPGDGTLSAAIAAAASGDVLVLESGGLYTESTEAILVIDKKIIFQAADGAADRPIIQNLSAAAGSGSARPHLFLLKGGASITCTFIEFDGLEPDTSAFKATDNLFVLDPAVENASIGHVMMDDCKIHRFTGKVIDGGENKLDGKNMTTDTFIKISYTHMTQPAICSV
ncbi:hypothetical protein BVY01_01145 [bacterium I07]|nr:hypothetical protein BVY01_01145 [bacterium I07]